MGTGPATAGKPKSSKLMTYYAGSTTAEELREAKGHKTSDGRECIVACLYTTPNPAYPQAVIVMEIEDA